MATISLDLIPHLLAVAELGSFSKAAQRLGVEKSSVSRAVLRLEEHFGERLFHRTTRRVSLTETGHAVCDRLREPTANLEAALHAIVDASNQPRGKLVVTTPPDFGCIILPEAIARFARRFPHVEIELRLTNEYLDLEEAGIDCAIRVASKRLADSSYKARMLAPMTASFYVSRAYAESYGTPRTPRDAESHRWIRFKPFQDGKFRGPDGPTQIRLQGGVLTADLMFMLHAVLQGLGIGILPAFLAEEHERLGRIVPILDGYNVGRSVLWFITPARGKRDRVVDAFRESIVEVMAARRLV